MPAPIKASDIDLTHLPGKQYFNLTREWREEFIYFLLIDRFHDDQSRSPTLQAGRTNGINTPDDFSAARSAESPITSTTLQASRQRAIALRTHVLPANFRRRTTFRTPFRIHLHTRVLADSLSGRDPGGL